MFGGTSTGAIVTTGLNIPFESEPSSNLIRKPKYTALDIVKIYSDHGQDIFPKDGQSSLGQRINYKYKSDGLISVLNTYMQDIRMEQLLNECIITATDCANEYTVKFKRDGFQRLEIRRAVLASASAPTYLPKAEIEYEGKKMTLVDGGVTMNNPSECVYDSALQNWRDRYDDLLMLSISCG
jgi:patatin-like phospholipase/acyl hydrolase